MAANFHCQATSSITSDKIDLCNNYFQLKVPFGVTILQNIYF